MWDVAEAAHNLVDCSLTEYFDTAFHHGVVLKTRRIFMFAFIMRMEGRGRVLLVWWLWLQRPATLADVGKVLRIAFGEDPPDWVAFARSLKDPTKDLKFFRPEVIERLCAKVSFHS